MTLARALWSVRTYTRRIWIRIALISGLALISAALAPFLSPLLPEGLKDRIDVGATADLLSILSSSMLTVATFSLSVMVAAHHYAASQATPRAHRLLRQDTRTQTVLATFIGAFVYALVTLILLHAGAYSPRDVVVVYAITILVIALVIVAIVRWIQHLSGLGSMEQTADRIEAAAVDALRSRMRSPCLGARPLEDASAIPSAAISVTAVDHGHLQYLDAASLQKAAERLDCDIYVVRSPGDWIQPGETLLRLAGPDDEIGEDEALKLRASLAIADTRAFDQDPEFGVQVVSEIGQRALSPGINDPRTATDIVQRQLRILKHWADEGRDEAEDPTYPRLHIPPLMAQDLVTSAFDYIARDGAGKIEVQLALQSALASLSRHPSAQMRRAAETVARRALAHAEQGLVLEQDRARIRAVAEAARSSG